MKHTFIGNTLEGLTDMEINVLQVALTHLIEELDDDEKISILDIRLNTAKKLYLGLGGKRFWELKMTEEDAKKLSKTLKEGDKK